MPVPQETYTISPYEPQQVQIWYQDPADVNLGQWVAVPRLRCDRLTLTVQPSENISSADLSYDYGDIDAYLAETPGFQEYAPLGTQNSVLARLSNYNPVDTRIINRFIRVVIFNAETGLPEARWVGVVVSAQDEFKQPRGGATFEDSVAAHGTQILRARGPEWIMNRKQLAHSRVRTNETKDESVANFDRAERALPFNVRNGKIGTGWLTGNKDIDYDVFAQTMEAATDWRGDSIMNYLLLEHYPTKLDSANPLDPFLDFQNVNERLLKDYRPQINVEGQTVLQVLRQLVNPRRFTNLTFPYVPGANDARFGSWNVQVNSATSLTITLPDGSIIPGNPNTISLPVSGTVGGRINLTEDAQNQYERVVVEGARRGHVVSRAIGFGTGSELFSEGWSGQDEADYEAGTTKSPTDRTDIFTLNSNLRTNQLRDVFTRFVCKDDFDFGAAGISDFFLYIPGLRWSRNTPLKEGWDYTVDPPVKKPGARENPEFRKLAAIYKFRNQIGGEAVFCYHNEIAEVIKDNDWYVPGETGSARIRPLDDAFGISLVPNREPHWQASDASVINTKVESSFNYKADIEVVGYFQEDIRVQGVWPIGPIPQFDSNTLYIRLGDIAFHDILHANTTVGIEEGAPVRSPNEDVNIRDDRALLQNIAILAHQWYTQRRAAYAISYAELTRDVFPGQVATLVDDKATDVAVTSVSWDFNRGQTNIATEYARPDIRALAQEAVLT